MEEKERYEYFFGTNTVKDNKTNQFYGCVVDLLNQQDKEIRQLKQSQNQLAIKIIKKLRDKICKIGYDEDYNIDYFTVMKEIDDEIKSLKGE